MGVVPIEGELFEDFIDGYFPLNVSLGHMLDRHGFASAWILMRVAPMMDIPDLAETEPVPLHLDPAHGGQIDWLSATIRLSGQTASLSGQARWNWNDPLKTKKDKIPTTLRLGEPAFLRGVQKRRFSKVPYLRTFEKRKTETLHFYSVGEGRPWKSMHFKTVSEKHKAAFLHYNVGSETRKS